MGDGARWIWGVSGEDFPTAQEIVDWYHAVDHLWTVAHLSFQDKAHQDRWVNKRKTELWLGQAEQIASTIAALAQQHPEHQADLRPKLVIFGMIIAACHIKSIGKRDIPLAVARLKVAVNNW